MVKKILFTSALFIGNLSSVFAGSFYLGPALNFESLRSNNNIRYEGLRAMAMGGYSVWVRDWLYLAAEVFGGPKPLDINNVPRHGLSLKTSYSYGGSLIPGIFLDDQIMPYARIGYLSTKFENPSTKKSAYQLGVGLEAKVIDCWSIRGEYDYVKYKNISGIGQVRTDEFNLAAIYRFL